MGTPDSHHLWFHKDGKTYKVAIEDIVYVEANGYATTVFCVEGGQQNQRTSYSSGYNLGRYQKLLTNKFYLIHRSYYVNLRFFKSFVRGRKFELSLEGFPLLPISRRMMTKLRTLVPVRNSPTQRD